MADALPLAGVVLLELGGRLAASACGSLLAEAGATVLRADPGRALGAAERPFLPGKRRIRSEPAEIQDALSRSDVVILCPDLDPDWTKGLEVPGGSIICEIVGGAPELDPGAQTDKSLQALTGIADMTGEGDGPPTVSEAPILELQAGMYAASGILAALRHRRVGGGGQRVHVSLYHCGINTLSSFLPLVYGGKEPRRAGNRHPMAVPWNSYRAQDGWLLLCSATDEHWRKLCDLMGRPDLASGEFEKLADRIARCDEVDRIVEVWTADRSVADCIAALGAAGLAAGPILDVADLPDEANLLHRGSIRSVSADGRNVPVPRSFLRLGSGETDAESHCQTAFATPAELPRLPDWPKRSTPAFPPLHGLRVIEIGQYTTAPLAAKQLATLGAEVIKVEPLEGEASRAWPPHQRGQGYFFTMNNANKRSVALDLRSADGKEIFRDLVRTSDVLIENMKPGSLDRLGFGWPALKDLNARLVYCAISGFGQDSAYPGRPAFDTVVQAMSGLMALTPVDGRPTKLGISVADVSGGIAGLFSVMVGLEGRERTGLGRMIDLSMQDVGVWLTGPAWGGARSRHRLEQQAGRWRVADEVGGWSREPVPVRSVSEIARLSEADPAGPLGVVIDGRGLSWPLFRSVLTFSTIPVAEPVPIGPLGEANKEVERLRLNPTLYSVGGGR